MSGLWDRTQVKKIVVHYLGAKGLGPVANTADLERAANPNGYQYPDYDFGILASGTVVSMRPLSVVGAHTQADKAPYDSYGYNWWNKNSASIVIGYGDAEIGPTDAQAISLAKFLIDWCASRHTTFDDIYPHFQVTATDCPAAKSTQLGLDTGMLDWDSIQEAVTKKDASLVRVIRPVVETASTGSDVSKEKTQKTPPVVVFFGENDRPGAGYMAQKVGASVTMLREEWEKEKPEPFYNIGGEPIEGAVENFPSEAGDWIATTQAVLDFLKEG